jgi:hypothetical protein
MVSCALDTDDMVIGGQGVVVKVDESKVGNVSTIVGITSKVFG